MGWAKDKRHGNKNSRKREKQEPVTIITRRQKQRKERQERQSEIWRYSVFNTSKGEQKSLTWIKSTHYVPDRKNKFFASGGLRMSGKK